MLRTLKPCDGKIGLVCSPLDAELTWHDVVSYNDRKDFKLVIEPTPYGCDVSVRPIGEDDMIETPQWVLWAICAAFIIGILGVICVRFY